MPGKDELVTSIKADVDALAALVPEAPPSPPTPPSPPPPPPPPEPEPPTPPSPPPPPPPVPPTPTPPGGTVDRFTMPDEPLPPVGPFVDKEPFSVTTPQVILEGKHFLNDYMVAKHLNPALLVELLRLRDVTGDNVGSFFYSGVGCGVTKAEIERVLGRNQRPGRPGLRIYGPCDQVNITDYRIDYSSLPNTMVGDIATGIQIGEKWKDGLVGAALEADKAKKRIGYLKVLRASVTNIISKLADAGRYWNGDGFTCEESVEFAEFDQIFVKVATDGAVDLKCKALIHLLRMEQARAALKLWNDTTIERLVSINPVLQGGIGGVSHLRIQGHKDTSKKPPVVIVKQAWLEGDDPLLQIENGPVEFHGVGHFEGSNVLARKGNGGSLANSTWNGNAIT